MNTKVGYSIALPAGYEGSDRRFPVLYFLHGRGGNESSPGNAKLVEILRKGIDAGTLPPMILVFPSGGQHTVYCDSVDGKYLSQSTFILELIPHIDATYRTIASKKGRAIQGMSMGGCGAFQMALKHPELFASSLSYAGGFVDAETMKGRVAMINEAMFGGDESRWMAENPVTLAGRVTMEARASLPLRLVCGSQDISLSDTMRMRNALLALQWDHDYLEYAGIPHHFGKLLEAEGDAGLQFAAKHFALSPATP